MTRNRGIIAFGIALFLILAGTGTASALWSSQSSTTTTIEAATMAIDQTGLDSLAVEYNTSTTSKIAPITVTNSGAVASTFSLVLSGPINNAIATRAIVQATVVTSAANCTSAVRFSGITTLDDGLTVTGSLAAAASTIYCVKTSLTSSQVSATVGQSMVVTSALTSASTITGDSWTASETATVTQSSRDNQAPSTPGAPTVSAVSWTSATVTWSASSDNVGVTAYDIYRGNTLLKAGVTSPYTDATLSRNNSYTYTVKARDAAGNTSAASPSVTATTPLVDSSIWLSVMASANSDKCVDASGGSTANGTALLMYDCNDGANQAWNFVSLGNGAYRVSAAHVTGSGWSVRSGSAAQLWAYDNATTSQWIVRAVGSTGTLFQFVNVSSANCLALNASATTNSSLSTVRCSSTSVAGPQVFTLAPAR
jgi:hypothetical protein